MAKTSNAGAGIDLDVLGDSDPTVSPEMAALQAQVAQLLQDNQAMREAAAAGDLEDVASASSSSSASKERFGITIDEGSGKHDLQEVPVQVNGRAYQIMRGQYAEVPMEVINVLNDAIIDKAISSVDALGMPAGITMRKMRRFPFQNHGLAIDADGKRVREAVAA